MNDLASALTNDTSAIPADVSGIYLLEKNISQVIFLELFFFFNILYYLFNLVSLGRYRTTFSRE
jgi:hypothetical protein